MSRSRLWDGRSGVCFSFYTKIIFKLTIDISMRKMIVEVEYFIKSMIYLNDSLFHPEMILKTLFALRY